MILHGGRWRALLGLLVDLWLAITICSCCGLIGIRAKPSFESPPTGVIISPQPTKMVVPPTSTPRPPTPVPPPTIASPTVGPSPATTKPTETPRAGGSSALGGLAAIPAETGSAFSIEVTQEELNEYLAGKIYEAQGVKVTEIQVVVTSQELLCTFRANQERTRLSAGLNVRGVPSVADGKAYFKVNKITLDDSVKGFARLLAQAAIDEAVKQYSTPQGIPVPVENVEFESIKLMPGRILVTGRRL